MIESISLEHFRSYSKASFKFDQGINLIIGPNASGKTNLMEAALVLSVGRSYRARDYEMVQFRQKQANLSGHLTNGSIRKVKLPIDSSKTFEIDGKSYKRLSKNQIEPVVLFEPEQLSLFYGSPDKRRDYLDNLLEQLYPSYSKLRQQYGRALAQRNTLLKQPGKVSQTAIFPWNIRLSELGGQIISYRAQLAELLNTLATKLYRALSDSKTDVKIKYLSQWEPDRYESQLMAKLDSTLDLDKARGFTSIGPHRDDLEVLFDDRPAQNVASRGESRTAILTLKLAEFELIEEAYDKPPILLLDDVFSELDTKRRQYLIDYLVRHQTFIATTDADTTKEHFGTSFQTFMLG